MNAKGCFESMFESPLVFPKECADSFLVACSCSFSSKLKLREAFEKQYEEAKAVLDGSDTVGDSVYKRIMMQDEFKNNVLILKDSPTKKSFNAKVSLIRNNLFKKEFRSFKSSFSLILTRT